MNVISAGNLSTVPSTGALLGSSGGGMMKALSQRFGGGFFGGKSDMLADKHRQFMDGVLNLFRGADQVARRVGNFLTRTGDTGFVPILTTEDLLIVPFQMHLPIMTDPWIRSLHQQGVIDGFGMDPDDVPEEDDTGRIINNGYSTIEYDPEKKKQEDVVLRWNMRFTDPEWTMDECNALRDTRGFIHNQLHDALTGDDEGPDPTNYPHPITGGLK